MNRKLFLLWSLSLFITVANAQANTKSSDKWLSLLKNNTQEELILAPDGEQTLILHLMSYPSINSLSESKISLAGLEFYQNVPSSVNITRYSYIELFSKDNISKTIRPKKGEILDYNWSPNSKFIALIIQNNKDINLWLYDVTSQKLNQLSPLSLSARIGGRHLRWLPNSNALIVKSILNKLSVDENSELRQAKIESVIGNCKYEHIIFSAAKRLGSTT